MMTKKYPEEMPGLSLHEWLEEFYFDGDYKETMSREDVVRLGEVIGCLLRFEPASRALARDLLNDPSSNDS